MRKAELVSIQYVGRNCEAIRKKTGTVQFMMLYGRNLYGGRYDVQIQTR
jgi:hypothetical protein